MIDALKTVLFESFVSLAIVLAIVLVLLLAIWRHTRTDRARRALVTGLVIAAALLVIQWIVVTRRERVHRLVQALVQAVDAPDIPAIEGNIADDYNQKGRDKAGLIDFITTTLERYQVAEPRVFGMQISFSDAGATVSFRVICDLRRRDQVSRNFLSGWELELVERNGRWRVSRIKLLEPAMLAPHLRGVF